MKRLNIRVSDDAHARLQTLADATGTSVQGLAESLLSEGMRRMLEDPQVRELAKARIERQAETFGLEL